MKRTVCLALVLGCLIVGLASADEIYIPDNNTTSGQGNVIPFGGVWPASSNPNGEFTYQWFIPASLLDSGGNGKASIVIPALPVLVGIRLHSAFVTLKAGEPFNLKSISPAYSFSITP